MSTRVERLRAALGRFVFSWYLPAALIVLLLAVVGYWLAPSRTHDIVVVGGSHAWSHDAAPPRSQVVWQPAVPEEVLPADAQRDDSLIRPQLTDGGATLYFTLRRGDGPADIYRARLQDGAWQPAEPVAQLNTDADDIGPVIRADGRRMFLYSDRPGGQGGFDLYVSRRTDNGWSTPENLGPRVNTPAHEFDPAVTSDGARLFFSSNRTGQMQQQITAGKTDDGRRQWSATLRAQQGMQQFDLYVIARADAGAAWSPAQPVAAVNRTDSNEGAPFVSPRDTFLYFASDRLNDRGGQPNFDLWRARITRGEVGPPENLGPGVNTAANETEPALSPEGFRLVFSSDRGRPGDDGHATAGKVDNVYALYSSTAAEVDERLAWDDRRWQALTAFLAHNWWWIVLALLILALLAATVRFLQSASFRRAPVPGLLLLALWFHFLLVGGSFLVYMDDGFIAQVKDELYEVILATEIPLHELDEPVEQPPVQMADLKVVEPLEPTPVQREATQPPNVPQPTERTIVQIPLPLNKHAPLPRENETPPDVQFALNDPALGRTDVQAPPPEPEAVQPDAPQPAADPSPVKLLPIEPPVEAIEPTTDPVRRVPRPLDPIKPINAPPAPRDDDVDAELALHTPPSQPLLPSQPSPLVRDHQNQPPPQRPDEAPRPDVSSPADSPGPSPQPAKIHVAEQDATGPPTPFSPSNEPGPIEVDPRQIVALRLPADPLGVENSAEDSPVTVETAGDSPPVKRSNAAVPAKFEEAGPSPDSPAGARPPSRRPFVAAKFAGGDGPADAPAAQPNVAGMKIDVNLPGIGRPRVVDLGVRSADAVAVPAPRSGSVQIELKRSGVAGKVSSDGNPTPDGISAAGIAAGKPQGSGRIPRAEFGTDGPESIAAGPRVDLPGPLGGPRDPLRRDLSVGELPKEDGEAVVSIAALDGGPLARQNGPALIRFEDENVALHAMFRLRSGEAKTRLLESLGGSQETEEAVRRGLLWIQQHQRGDGGWSLNRFADECQRRGHPRCGGQGTINCDTAATGFALLPFLGAGHTHRKGDYRRTVEQGLNWLVKNQKPNGNLYTGGHGNSEMYSHGIATIALCEAYGMSEDPRLREPARKAIEFIVKAQSEKTGGWRYHPRQDADTSVVGWQVMALTSGRMAGLDIPTRTLDGADRWLNTVEGKNKKRGQFGYQQGGTTPAMTAEALLCRKYLGRQRDDPGLRAGAKYLLGKLPKKNQETSYYWYYGTQFMFYMQGESWQKWNESLRDMLVETQVKQDHLAGTWDPRDHWEHQAGRLYGTSLRLLMLEVYYRHVPLPLYQVLQ